MKTLRGFFLVSSALVFASCTVGQHKKMKRVKAIVAVIAAVLICGCPAMPTNPPVRPERITVQGSYLHAPSRITLPESVDEFKRGDVVRYDAQGLDISAAYNRTDPDLVAATVYVYPAPSVKSFGSPPEVVAGAKARLAEREFANRQQELIHVHPNAKLISQRDTTRVDHGQRFYGKAAVYEYEDTFAGVRIPVRSHLYVYYYVNDQWIVKYRFTHPQSAKAEKTIQDFIWSLSWL